MVKPGIRALFPQDPASGFTPLGSSPPRWSDQYSVPSLPPGQTHGPLYPGNQSPSYNRLTSTPIDPWATPGKQHSSQQQQDLPAVPGYPDPIGHSRTSPPGMKNTGSSRFYSSTQQSQLFSPEGPYGGTTGYHSTGSSSSNHLYSGKNSPVQGLSGTIANYSSDAAQHHQRDHHPSPQRPLSGSFISRENLQFLEDKMIPGPAFGPGYGPSLNSGNARSHQQAMYPQQVGQAYPLQSSFGLPIQYPQQRQRHSSHNSTTSHHTMFLGPIDEGLGSAGGSVNSDDISTEDESDDPLDDMRSRYLSYQYQHQGVQGGYGPQTPSHSVLASRRGSAPSMGSAYSNQQLYPSGSPHSTAPLPNVLRLSNSSNDLHDRKSLTNPMSRLSMGPSLDSGFDTRRSFASLGGGYSGAMGVSAGPPLNIANLTSASDFGNERDLFSSGLGGIIGGGTISHSTNLGAHTHTNPHQLSGISGQGQVSRNSSQGLKDGYIGSTLSPSALPFLAESALNRSGQHMVGGWDR